MTKDAHNYHDNFTKTMNEKGELCLDWVHRMTVRSNETSQCMNTIASLQNVVIMWSGRVF